MTPLTMTALTQAWIHIDHITLIDREGNSHEGFPSKIQRLFDGYVSITLTCGVEEVVTVLYRLTGDGETLEPVR